MSDSIRVGRWAALALGAQVTFVLSWLVAAAWQGPHYSVLKHSISDMYAVGTPGGLFLVVVLTVCGAAVVGFALRSVRPVLQPAGWSATAGSVLLALSIFGLGDLLSPFEREGCRLADPGCTAADQLANPGGRADAILSTVGVLAAIAACFFLAAAMAKLPPWQRWAGSARGAGVALIVLLAATGLGAGLSGLFERLLAAAGAFAIAGLAWLVLGRAARV